MAKSKCYNFNEYMLEFPHSPLGKVWEAKRGRMTRVSVEKRALAYGLQAGQGAAQWDAFVLFSIDLAHKAAA